MLLNLFRPTPPKQVLPKDFIEYERTRTLEHHKTRRQTIRQAYILGLVTLGVSVMFALIGLALVALGGAEATSAISMFGQSIETGSMGVACLFIGAVTLGIVLPAVLKVMSAAARQDWDSRRNTPDDGGSTRPLGTGPRDPISRAARFVFPFVGAPFMTRDPDHRTMSAGATRLLPPAGRGWEGDEAPHATVAPTASTPPRPSPVQGSESLVCARRPRHPDLSSGSNQAGWS